MARTRTHTRRYPRSNPRGVLSMRDGGFGFVQTAEGEFFIPSSKIAGAFDGDLVEVVALPVTSGGKRQPRENSSNISWPGEAPAARVVRVLDRAHDVIVGRYEVAEPFGVVVPADARIPYDVFTMRADRPDIDDGALVRVRITTFPSRTTAATGVVEEVLGRADDETAMIEMTVARHKLETIFSDATLVEARAATLDVEGALAQGYQDLRDRVVFTIDPTDARDFDDALSLEPVVLTNTDTLGAAQSLVDSAASVTNPAISSLQQHEKPHHLNLVRVGTREFSEARWRLGVHIADVSYYVPWDSSIDLDARRRATSVYLVDRVIPMLPDELSGNLCSLKPGETRRAMVVDLYLDDEARLVAYDLYSALICSNARLTYDEAHEMLGDEEPSAGEFDLSWRLRELSRLARKRMAARTRAGGLDFDTVEARVRLDEEGHPLAIDVRRKTEATSLVEEAMILANETVAAHLRDAGFPSLYRVHEQPAADHLAALVPVLQEFSWFSEIDQDMLVAGEAHTLQRILAASSQRPEAELVSSLVLRAMKRAVYRPVCEPHYGLASTAYTHFTSPIRRYPDLVVHRMLKAQLTYHPERIDKEIAALSWIAEHSSDMERVAEKASRESQEIKLIEYLATFVNTTFTAVVSGVVTYGVYVRLDNTAEGLVPAASLGEEYFSFDPVLHRLIGQDTGTVYRLGQCVRVVLIEAEPRSRHLEFRLANPAGKKSAERRHTHRE